jgi:hypothetical protein
MRTFGQGEVIFDSEVHFVSEASPSARGSRPEELSTKQADFG